MHPDMRRVRLVNAIRQDRAALGHCRAIEDADRGDWWNSRQDAEAGLMHIEGLHGRRAVQLRALLERDRWRAVAQLGA